MIILLGGSGTGVFPADVSNWVSVRPIGYLLVMARPNPVGLPMSVCSMLLCVFCSILSDFLLLTLIAIAIYLIQILSPLDEYWKSDTITNFTESY